MTALPLLLLGASVALLVASKTERALLLPCDSGAYTASGECCLECPPGEGVVRKCGAKQTLCAQCLDSETFSENYSHTEECQPCTQCTGLMRMDTPCTDSNDAICVCQYNFFFSRVSGRCEPCTVCPAGQGVFAHCEHFHDTVCEECEDYTFSDRDSSLDPCLPCTICDDETEVQLDVCTPTSDSVCHNPNLPSEEPSTTLEPSTPVSSTNHFPPDGSDNPPPSGETTTSSAGSPRFLGHGFNENLIPVYCSIPAVLGGLLAYVVFKRWNSCKQNKQAANQRAAAAAAESQMVTPEGEKLHSDSGISVDSQSLQEQQGDGPAPRSHTQEQIVVRVDGAPQPTPPPPQV